MPDKHTTPKYVPSDYWGTLDLDGVRVMVYRYAESGQVHVSVNTEDALYDNNESGNPSIFVGLNDAVLYDGDEGDES